MPIYEFYCPDCHVIFTFLSRRVDPQTKPDCPRCDRAELARRVSPFAISKGREQPEQEDFPDLDESKVEQAMNALATRAEQLDEENPRQAAQLMREFVQATGMPLGEGMESALERIEAGEDPDKVEEEMSDLLDEDPLGATSKKSIGRIRQRILPPHVDPKLYELN